MLDGFFYHCKTIKPFNYLTIQNPTKYIKAVENCLTQQTSKLTVHQINALARYIGTGHKVLGLDTSFQRQMAKKNYDLQLHHDEFLEVFDVIFRQSKVFEFKSAALFFVEHHYKKFDKKKLFKVMLPWVNYVDNWAHSDYLSKFYTRFLEEETIKTNFLSHLKKWNRDKNSWKRRQSMVALLYYARTKQKHLDFNTIIAFVEPLLNDAEYFVQKGLGWTLRETYNLFPYFTFKFVNKNFNKVSSVAFSAACEKMTLKEKNVLKQKRKEFRKAK